MQDQASSEPLCPPLCDGDGDLGLARWMGVVEKVDVKGLTHHRYTENTEHARPVVCPAVALLFV